jgi:hypothetical protein
MTWRHAMPILLHSVRGTVQGVFAAGCHVLWYVNWQTGGGRAVRDAR